MQELLTTKQGREILGIPTSTFAWWVRQGAVSPAVPGSGKGSPQVFTAQQIWAVGIAKSLRGGGVDVDTCCRVANFLEGLPPAKVEKALAEGRTCLLITRIDDQANFMPKLISPDAIIDNPHLKQVRAEAEANGLTFQFTGIDVKPMLKQILTAVEEQAARRGQTRRRP